MDRGRERFRRIRATSHVIKTERLICSYLHCIVALIAIFTWSRLNMIYAKLCHPHSYYRAVPKVLYNDKREIDYSTEKSRWD